MDLPFPSRPLSRLPTLVDPGDSTAADLVVDLDIQLVAAERGVAHIHRRVVAVLERSHWVLALELGGLGHISQARIVGRGQHMDCGEQGRLGVRLKRDVLELQRSSQVLALAARRRLVGDELVVVERAALFVKEQAAWGMVRGQKEDRIEVSTALAIGHMAFDVMGAAMQRLERCKGWTWDRC